MPSSIGLATFTAETSSLRLSVPASMRVLLGMPGSSAFPRMPSRPGAHAVVRPGPRAPSRPGGAGGVLDRGVELRQVAERVDLGPVAVGDPLAAEAVAGADPVGVAPEGVELARAGAVEGEVGVQEAERVPRLRSEEHTSELQSRL